MNKLLSKTLLGVTVLLAFACSKDKYFFDTGISSPTYDGSILDYLNSKPEYFDTLVRVVKIAEMEEVLSKESTTLFAPTSSTIYKSVKNLNAYLRLNGKDTVAQLEQIKPVVWKEMLALYIIKGSYRLKDIPQIDTTAITAYPGQGYNSYSGRTMNLGSFYRDAGGVKYAGYRHLILSYIPDFSKPLENLRNVQIVSHDIAPKNGIVHVLLQNKHVFGFDTNQFITTAVENGILPAKP